MRKKYEPLTDSQWQVIAEILDVQRKRKIALREVVNAIRWLNETGCQWRNLPAIFPHWSVVYYYFQRWKRDGTLVALNIWLTSLERQAQGKEATPSVVCVDSQSVKIVPFTQNDKGIDAHKRINGRKRQVMVDTLGLVWAVFVHSANGNDSVWGTHLMEQVEGVCQRLKKVLTDKGYDGDFKTLIPQLYGVEVEISSRPPTDRGFVPLKWRWVSERTFGCFNFFRRLSKDYEKTVESSASWILWANCQMILAKWQST
jgi:putative transposase